MTSGIPLGPFMLHDRIGRGGMAEVWRGVHVQQNVPVAVKVITGAMSRHAQYLNAFRNEVLAVARLRHPRIIMVLDYGEVTGEAARLSRAKLSAGSPYLAMELASRGTLGDLQVPLPFSVLHTCLLTLMDALSHAHARGVIHRDLKPQNVLWCSKTDARPGLKVSDFGLAQPLEGLDDDDSGAMAGTPHFMAPEQFRADWRDYGPWTDLYALGCMAYLFSVGQLPFGGPVLRLATAHSYDPPPPMVLGPTYPRSFEMWVMRLLEKEPSGRYESVADAAWALMRVAADAERIEEPERLVVAPAGSATLPPFLPATEAAGEWNTLPMTPISNAQEELLASFMQPTTLDTVPHDSFPTIPAPRGPPTVSNLQFPTMAWDVDSEPEPLTATAEHALRGTSVPPLPVTWRRGISRAPSLRLVGAGLGLYGMRSIELVDRDAARDAIWDALKGAHETQSARVVVLRGPAGTGKSRIAEWMAQRALELGAATVLKAVHAPVPGPGQGLGRMVAQHLQAVGMERANLLRRVERILRRHGVADAHQWEALAELIQPRTGDEGASGVRLRSARERHAVVRSYLEQLAKTRPVLVWLDDVQWGEDALLFALHLLEIHHRHPFPLLLILTVREEALADRPDEANRLIELLAHPSTQSLAVDPLGHDDHRMLVEELLGLEAHLASQVAERTAGNPLFAVQLVGDWVQRGVLEVKPEGFALKSDESAPLPDDIHSVWSARIGELLRGQPQDAQTALELAAALGIVVDEEEWHAACALARVRLPVALVAGLLARRLVVREEAGLRFVHAMLRESVERGAREAGRLVEHHAVISGVLEPQARRGVPGVVERLGRHQVEAGLLDAALGSLQSAAEERYRASEYNVARALLDLREEVMKRLRANSDDRRWVEALVLRSRLAGEQGHLEESLRHADHALRIARTPEALSARADVLYRKVELRQARELYAEARGAYAALDDKHGVAECLNGMADSEYRQGNHAVAEHHYREALEVAEHNDDAPSIARCLWGLGYIAMWRGSHEEARQLFDRQLGIFQRLGNRYGVTTATNALAELSRLAGRFQEAEAEYRRALALAESIGASNRLIITLNLSIVLMEQEAFAAAKKEVLTVWDDVRREREGIPLIAGHLTLMVCAAAAADWQGFDEHFGGCIDVIDRTSVQDADLARVFEIGAEQAMRHGDFQRARRALDAASKQWAALGQLEKVVALETAWMSKAGDFA